MTELAERNIYHQPASNLELKPKKGKVMIEKKDLYFEGEGTSAIKEWLDAKGKRVFVLREECDAGAGEPPYKTFVPIPPKLLKRLEKDYGRLRPGATRTFPKGTGPQIMAEEEENKVTRKIAYKGKPYSWFRDR